MNRKRLAAALAYVDEKAKRLTSLDQPKESDAVDMALEMGGSFIPGVGQALAARDFERARRADDEAGMAMAAASALPVGRLIGALKGFDPVMREIDVYHGSPHRFDEFDASKIGTGEGAQAYGHGIYLAESPKVAEGYKKTVTQSMTTGAQRRLQSAGGDIDKAIAETEAKLAKYRQGGAKSYADVAEEDLRGLNQYKQSGEWASGNLYTADLPDEMVDRMLDWDKPLSEQRELATPILKELGYLRPNDDGPRQFAQAVKALDMEYGGFGESGANGMALFKAIYRGLEQGKPKVIDFAKRMNLGDQAMFMEASPLASEVMKRMGIPGIRYLDAGSRGQGGSGTRNFVVFPGEEKKVKILKRE